MIVAIVKGCLTKSLLILLSYKDFYKKPLTIATVIIFANARIV